MQARIANSYFEDTSVYQQANYDISSANKLARQ
jgi:hypothetical protein